jgi:hypothetical protein
MYNFHTQHTTVCECSLHFLSPPLRIQSHLVACNVCQTQTPFSQTTTAALSVGRPCNYIHVRNKHQCCYLSLFTLLSLLWNERKNVGHYFLSKLRTFILDVVFGFKGESELRENLEGMIKEKHEIQHVNKLLYLEDFFMCGWYMKLRLKS